MKKTPTIGRFELRKTLGSGASCKVKLGIDTATGNKVAVKILNDNLGDAMKGVVMNEVKAMSDLSDHAHVLRLIDHGKGTYEKPDGDKEV